MILTINDDDDDDYEPFFHQRYSLGDYWEDYDRSNKTWSRLCHECMEKVCPSSASLCASHHKRATKSKTKPKRLNTKKMRKKQQPLSVIVENEMEESLDEEITEPTGIVISVSSSLSKKQLSQVKEFIVKFHSSSQPIQLACESQPDYIDDTTTHVIANDCGSCTTSLTKQIVQACVRHVFIGSIKWIISSLEQSCILDHFPYEILRDTKSLPNTRGIKQCRFDQLPVFPSSCILSVECHFRQPLLQITRDELIEIIELSGATLLNDYIEYETLIILCHTKKEMLARKKSMENMEKKIYYCKPNFLFDSIVRHEVQAIEKYVW